MTAPHQNLLGISGAVDTEETDPNFNQTVLLLHADGTNGGTNNTFLDSSSENHTITRGANATQGTFNPYLGDGQYGVRFEQTAGNQGDDLEFTGLNFTNTGSFCVELFFYKSVLGQTNIMFSSDVNDRIQIYVNSSNEFGFNMAGTGTATFLVASGISANQWHHFCITRDSSNNVRGFIDGVLKAYKTSITDNQVLNDIHIGSQKNDNHHTDGIISNVRFVASSMPSAYDTSETATGTTCFTIPSEALTLTSQGTTGGNVKLLCCQSNRFIDNSNNNFTAVPQKQTQSSGTNTTGPKVVPFSPFAPTASYSKLVHGGSGYFDGDGDVVFATETGSEFTYGTGDFEFSCWVYRTVDGVQQTLFGRDSTGDVLVPYVYITGGNKLAIYYTSSINFATSTDVPKNAWCHLVVSRVSGTIKFFQDGVEVGSVSNTTTLIASGKVAVGNQHTGGSTNALTGYIADARVRKGTGVTSVTVPTTPVTAETGTVLLLNFTNASIIDQTMVNNIETVGDAQLDTSVKKFGTASVKFPSGDALAYDSGMGLGLGTGPFTVELFVRFIDNVNAGGSDGNNSRASIVRSVSAGSGNMVIQRYNPSDPGTPQWQVGTEPTPQIKADQNLSNGVFYHVAMSRDSSNKLRLFIDGTMIDSATSFTTDFPENDFYFANLSRTGGSSRFLNGFLDEIRITKGIARYDSDSGFTPPTKAFANR